MKAKKQDNTLYTLSILLSRFILFPMLIVIAALLIISYYSYTTHKEQLQTTLMSSLRQYASESESRIQSIINLTSALQNDAEFMNALTQSSADGPVDFSEARNTMQSYMNTYDTIDNMYIYDKKASYIISPAAIYPAEEYYGSVYKYENYGNSYWNSLLFFDSSYYRILSPTTADTGDEKRHVIPVVFRQIGKTRFKNLLVVDISLDRLMSSNDTYKYTENTQIYVLNKFNGQLFNGKPGDTSVNIIDTDLYKALVSGKKLFENTVDEKKCQIIAISATDTLDGYTYFAAVPFSDIRKIQQPLIFITIIVTLAFIVLAFAAAFHNTFKLAKPLHQLADILNINLNDSCAKRNGSFFDNIKQTALDLSKQSSQLSVTLPFAQENYLINFLNSTDYTIDSSAQAVIKNTLPFKYDYFAAVVLQLYPTNEFYNTYTSSEYYHIQTGFYDIVRDLFGSQFSIFCLPSAKESLYIILNVPNESSMKDIDAVIDVIFDCMKNDMNDVNLYIGKGGIYKDLDGLKKAHSEAIKNLNVIPNPTPQITLNQKKQPASALGKSNEDKLFNSLVALDTERAREIIINVLYNENTSADSRSQKQLYSQVLNILFRVMKIKNIPVDDTKMDFELYSEILSKEPDDIYRHILLYLDKISSYAQSNSARLAGDSMIEYINENFLNPDISLEDIASRFNTTSSYVSLTVKNKLGIGFYKYLTGLRIEKAKELLDTTDDSVQQICEETGFSSKQTFFRTFKSAAGMTPSEYRKRNK